MHARDTARTDDPLAGLPSLPLLEGLARIHRWILVVDSRRRVAWSSRGLAELLGVKEIRPGSDAREFLSMLPRPEQVLPVRSTLRGRGQISGAPLALRGSDGADLEIDVDIVRVAAGSEEYVVAIASDHREPSGGALDGELVAALEDALLAVDVDGFVRRANPAACRLFGADEKRLLAQPVSMLLARCGGDVESLAALLSGPLQGGEAELELDDAEGETLTLRAVVMRLPSGLRGLRLRARNAEQRELETARRANDELEHMLGVIAHDLRSPLAGVLGFTRLLRQDYEEVLDDTGRHFVDRIERGARSMERLLSDLLELARIGEPGEVPALVDAHVLLRQLAADVKPRLEESGIEMVLPEEQSSPLYCDRVRLYQVFANLVGNAIQHMGSRPDGRIEVQIRETPDAHEIVVADNGRGVDPAHREHIFEIFQSFGRKEEGGGTGMGLAIVRRIVEKYGGRIWLEETEGGEGARFHVTLPRP